MYTTYKKSILSTKSDTIYTQSTRYMHVHHVPYGKHVETCRLDKMAESDPDVWSVPIAMPCCPPLIVFHLFVNEQSELLRC